MRFITFGKIHKQTFYPFITSIFSILRTYSFKYFPENQNFDCPLLFQVILMFLGMFICFIFEIITVCRQDRVARGSKKKEKCKKYCFDLISNWRLQLILCLLAILDLSEFIGLSVLFLAENYEDNRLLSTTRMLEFLFVGFMYYYFLKTSLHRHNYISLLLIVGGLAMVMFGQSKLFTFRPILLIAIFGNLFYACLEITEKWLMDKKFISPYEIIYCEGLYGFIIILILCLIGNKVDCQSWMYLCSTGESVINLNSILKEVFSSYSYVIEVVIYVFTSAGYNIFIHLCNKDLGPTHHIVADAFGSMVVMLVSLILSEGKITLWMQIVGHILIVMGTLVYNEIIIFHFLGMDKNTKDEIAQRALINGKDSTEQLIEVIFNKKYGLGVDSQCKEKEKDDSDN